MDLSKFNISANKRAIIREKVLKVCPKIQAKAPECDSADNKTEEILVTKKEEPFQVPECRSDVLFAEKDEGFPMITSVFSLAPPGTQLGSSINTLPITTPPITATGNTTNPSTRSSSLPFVVQCTNGVITVCSPPFNSPIFTTSPVEILPRPYQPPPLPPTSNTPSLTASTIGANISATKATEEHQTKPSNETCPQPVENQADDIPQPHISGQLEYEQEESNPCDKSASSEKRTINNADVDIEANSSITTDNYISEPLKDSTESEKDVPVVTKHDDRIRRLKDLLRQQESELEKVRFKKKSDTALESSSSGSSTPTNSLKRDLRLQILKKTVAPESVKSQIGKAIQSGPTSEAIPSPVEQEERYTQNEKLLKSPTDSKTLKRKCIETINKVGTPSKRKESFVIGNELRQNIRSCTDKYRLVNVTVVKGHTRTLAVPVNAGNQPATLLKKIIKQPKIKQVVAEKRKNVEKPIRVGKVSKQDAVASGRRGEVCAKPGDRGCAPALLKTSPSVIPSCTPSNNHTATVSSNKTTLCAKASTRNTMFKVMTRPVNSTATESSVAITPAALTQDGFKQATVLNTNNTVFRFIPQASMATPVLNTAAIAGTTITPSLKHANKVSPSTNKSILVSTQNGGVVRISSSNTVPSATLNALSAQLTINPQNTFRNFTTGNAATVCANQVLLAGLTSPNNTNAQRLLHTIAPKPALTAAATQATQAPNAANLKDKVVIYALPKSVGVAGTNNLENRQIIVCNVIQPNRPVNNNQGNVLVSPSDKGNLVVYVTNKGGNPNLGFLNEKIIFKTQKPPVTPTTPVDNPKKTDEFIPNAEDADFTRLVGLEHVVQSLNSK